MKLKSLFKRPAVKAAAFIPDPSAEQVKAWQDRYGDKLQGLTFDGEVLYVRQPTDSEAAEVIRNLCAGGRRLRKGEYIRCILNRVALGGDERLKTDPELINQLKQAWAA